MKPKILITNQKLPRFIRRNRRILAALSAGIAVLAFTQTTSSNISESQDQSLPIIPSGKSVLAIEISSELMGKAISVGRFVDLISTQDGYANIVARNAQILQLGQSSAGFGGSAIEVLVAVSITEATRVAAANEDGSLQVMLSPANS